jgi:hypothetical protein
LGEEDEVPSRMTSIQAGGVGDDEDITISDTTIPSIELQGPIMITSTTTISSDKLVLMHVC